ncbi:hypothetical protein SIO70_15945 [Chitinophaga sancti]|uniref:hypothetical protein n=1 Tax=Chitinophaga sancti TaxID=1004 RepID=UPI002A75FBE7|nr:hypothetical protein [Chitinophaga sancti]WPQ66351.1 hypothetical protein SIO70_15945 [Chitinophaga sancti]
MDTIIIHSLETHPPVPDQNPFYEVIDGEGNPPSDSEFEAIRLRRYSTDTDLRKHITYSFIINITCWLFTVMTVLYFNNFLLQLHLSDAVLITLLTTSTLNVIGMMTIILKNLFPIQTEKLKPQSVLD